MASVSVVVAAYNQAHYLAQALQSVLCQTMGDFELIVVDDGSVDDTAEVVRSVSDPRVRYLFQQNSGLSAARNTGIRNSSGRYLTFLDSDDQFLPSKLEVLAGALDRCPEAGIAAGQAIPVDEEGTRIGKVFDSPLPDEPSKLLLGNPLHVGSVLLRRSWQEKVGYFDESLRSYEDWDLWIRLALAGCRPIWVPAPVSLYRFHRAQMTRIGTQMTTATFAVLDKCFVLPEVPEACLAVKDLAYSRAHLRAAAQAYLACSYDQAGDHLRRAMRLNPRLTENGAAALADHFRSWVELPKTGDPIGFLERIYSHLPDELAELARRRAPQLANAAAQFAFESFNSGDHHGAMRHAIRAIRYRPALLANRGLVSLLLRSIAARKRT